MLSVEEEAVRRVLGALEAMLLGRGQAKSQDCADCPRRGERYCLASTAGRELYGKLAQARSFAEMSLANADRALEAVEEAIASEAGAFTTQPQ